MKKAINISIILLFIVAACITDQILIKTYFNKTGEFVSTIKAYIEENENVNTPFLIEKTNELNDYWQSKESIVCTFVNHQDISNLGTEINKLQSAAKENNRDVFVESINLIEFYLAGYEHVVGINLQSIF